MFKDKNKEKENERILQLEEELKEAKRANKDLSKRDIIEKEEAEENRRLVKHLKEKNLELEKKVNSTITQLSSKEEESLTVSTEVKKAKAQAELYKVQLKDINALLEQYRQLPDLKNMIDNLSTLTTPSIDKLVELVKATDFKDVIALTETLKNVEKKMDTVLDIFSSRRMY